MTLRKGIIWTVGTLAIGFFAGEFASTSRVHAQPRLQVYVQSVGDPHAQKPTNLQGSKVVGFSCADGTCYVATE
jgi:hypothetical protein